MLATRTEARHMTLWRRGENGHNYAELWRTDYGYLVRTRCKAVGMEHEFHGHNESYEQATQQFLDYVQVVYASV